MKTNSWAKQEEKLVTLDSLDNVSDIVDEGKVVKFYWCGHCGRYLGAIETICDGEHIKERDDIVDWTYCPYCGRFLWE